MMSLIEENNRESVTSSSVNKNTRSSVINRKSLLVSDVNRGSIFKDGHGNELTETTRQRLFSEKTKKPVS